MAVPFGFSVGDCIAVCLLIKDAVKALDDSRGASAEYQEVIRELWSLDRALLEVELLSRIYESTIELNALSCTAKRTAEQCRVCIEGFLDTIKRYNKALRQGGSGSVWRDVKGKVLWSILRKDDLSKFRTEINTHSSVLNMLLLTANLSLAKLNDMKLNERLRVSDNQLNQKLDNNTRRLDAQGSVLARLADGMTYFRTLGTELKSFMTNIWTLSFSSYRILLDLQTRVPREFGPCWIQEPLTFTDALGRIAPIHLELINSWDVFEAVLEARFLNFPGERKIKSREYAISDSASEQDLVRSQAFALAFLPGRRIDMCMLFQEQGFDNCCPGCGQTSDSLDSTATTCLKCGLWFRRIQDLNEVQEVPVEEPEVLQNFDIFTPVTLHEQLDGLPIVDLISNNSQSNRGSSKRKRDASYFYQEDVSSFKRVRLLQRKQQHREHIEEFVSRLGRSVSALIREHCAPEDLRYNSEYAVGINFGFGPPIDLCVCPFTPRDKKAPRSYQKHEGKDKFDVQETLPVFMDLFSIESHAKQLDTWLDGTIDSEFGPPEYVDLIMLRQKDYHFSQVLKALISWYMASKNKFSEPAHQILRTALKLLITTTLLSLVPKVINLPGSLFNYLSLQSPAQAATHLSLEAPRPLICQIKASIYYLQQQFLHALFFHFTYPIELDADIKIAIALLVAYVLDLARNAGREFERNIRTQLFQRVWASVLNADVRMGGLAERLRNLDSIVKWKEKESEEHQFVCAILEAVL